MAKKALSAPEIPLCINVLRLLNYRLAPDELILFDWLTVKQISFKYKPFHYSQARVEEETRIRRTRQEVIIKQFSALGFLKTDIKVNSVTRGRVRYYSVDFSVLADVAYSGRYYPGEGGNSAECGQNLYRCPARVGTLRPGMAGGSDSAAREERRRNGR